MNRFSCRRVRVGDFLVSRRPAARSGLVGEVLSVSKRGGRPVTVLWEDGQFGWMTGYYVHADPRCHDGYLLLGRERDR